MPTAYQITTPRTCRFAITGVPTRDVSSIANVKRALISDATLYLRGRVAEVSGPGAEASIDVTESYKVIEPPTLTTREDHSIIRTTGLAEFTVVATARAS